MKEDPKVTFQIISTGNIRAELSVFAAFMARSGARLSQFMGHSGYMPTDRNEGILQWLDGGDEDCLIQCDQDTIPPVTILDLAKHRVDLVGSTYLCNSDRGLMVAAKAFNEPCVGCSGKKCKNCNGDGLITPSVFPKESEAAPDIIKVDWFGTGCYCISRRLAEDFIAREGHVFRFHMDEKGRKKEGVDVDMCRRARKLGYDVWLDRGQTCGHSKNVTWALAKGGRLLQLPWGTYWRGADVPESVNDRRPIGEVLKTSNPQETADEVADEDIQDS